MPTVFRHGPYRFFFYSTDREEPPHIHVQRENRVAKFWLQPISISDAGDFEAFEIRRIHSLVEGQASLLLKAWYEFFSH